jgi:DNA polymerase I-like protein with 3'-5' exonuclease and polymerase domains
MARYFFDLETDGFLDTVSVIHSLVLEDVDTGEVFSCADQPGYHSIREGLTRLLHAEEVIGHNVIKYDIPVIEKLFPDLTPKGKVTDTAVMARLWRSADALREHDAPLVRRGILPRNLIGAHSLEAWGYRTGVFKDDYTGGWDVWSKTMQDYCVQDVRATAALYRDLLTKDLSPRAVSLEHAVALIISRQERRGFAFDEEAALALRIELEKERAEVTHKLREAFHPWYEPERKGGMIVERDPKVSRPKDGIAKGCRYVKIDLVSFNPASRAHLAKRLKALYGWTPTEFTPTGEPKIDDDILGQLPWPEAKLAARYLMLEKRLGQLAEGQEAWLSRVRDGRLYGGVNTLGAHTGRMTHHSPNLAQVPSLRAPYGKNCRALFTASPGFVLVGIDAEALELCCLAHFLAKYDGGAYIETVLNGDKTKGTDIHSVNARALGLDPTKSYLVEGQHQSGRDIAKTWFYAWLYGAGDVKLGETLGASGTRGAKARVGRKGAERFARALPAAGKLVKAVTETLAAQKFLYGLDRRKLYPRNARAAINTLLQSAGAVIMKEALVILDVRLQALGMTPGVDYEFVANVHDEWQIECLPQHVETIKREGPESIRQAGISLNFRCPLRGSAVHGQSWADTH